MKVERIIPESSIDFPGNFGPVFFVHGCNFRCGFCHNPELIKKSPDKDAEKKLDEFLKSIKNKIDSNWYTGVCISGGEPTLYSDLPDFLKELKKLGLKVKLDTNGSNPEILKKLIDEKIIDYIAMDIKGCPEIYNRVTGVEVDLKKIEKSMALISNLPEEKYEFRTTFVPIEHSGKFRWMSDEEIRKMAEWVFKICGEKNCLWRIQAFISRSENEGGVLDKEFNKESLKKEMHETPKKELERAEKIIKTYFPNCKIV